MLRTYTQFTGYVSGDEVKVTSGRVFVGRNQEVRVHFEAIVLVGRIILKRVLIRWKCVD
jgi:hypothetical protein